MSLTWETIPLLPLRCILEHLSMEDAVAAMSTCRHWRNAIALYEGYKDPLTLNAKQLDKNLFLTRIFRKCTRTLHIYMDCTEAELEKFMKLVLPQYFDTAKLQELMFIGPSYVEQGFHVPPIKLKRILTESLVFKHQHSIKKLAFMGCNIGTMQNENERYTHKNLEYYSRPLKFSCVQTPADSVLSSANIHLMQKSAFTHLVVDYEQINTASLETLSHLPNFRKLSLIITNKRQALTPVDWYHLDDIYKQPLQVTVNIIAVPYRRLDYVMQNVLVEGLTLVSLKVMFCQSLYAPLLNHVSRVYQITLREVLWADSPYDSTDPYHRVVRPQRSQEHDTAHVNPFVLLCWQCVNLERLVIHGYWVWQYDLLGFVRLRKGLSHLEVSAIYNRQDRFTSALQMSDEGVVRVLRGDSPAAIDSGYVKEINQYMEFKWKPTLWSKLHPALRGRSTPEQRADYVVQEARKPLGYIVNRPAIGQDRVVWVE